MFTDVSNKIEKAKSIAFIGTGALGIEFAGDIHFKYPNKQLTLIGTSICPFPKILPDSIREAISDTLKDMNIRYVEAHATNVPKSPSVWEDRILENFTVEFSTNCPKETFDLVILSTGLKPNNSFTIDGESQDGFLNVDN